MSIGVAQGRRRSIALPYQDPTGNAAVANVMHEEQTRDAYPQSWAETVLHMLTDDASDNEDVAYLLRTLAPQLAA